jgi:hypothetical protein
MGLWRAKIRSLLLCLAGTGFNDVAFFAEKEFEPESSGRSQKTALHAESWQRHYRGSTLIRSWTGTFLPTGSRCCTRD